MDTTASITYAIIGAEIFSLITGLVLLIASIVENKIKTKRGRWFTLLVLTDMVGCFCDALSWLLDGRADMNTVLYVTTLGSMTMTMVMAGIFVSYVSAYINEKEVISVLPAKIGWVVVAIGVLATIIGSAAGYLFTFQNGVFTEKPVYSVYVIANTCYAAIGIVVITKYRALLARMDRLAAYAYLLIPAISVTIGLLVDGWDFTYPAITVSLLLLYIMLQSDRTKRLESAGTIAGYQATHDDLTGLNNRNAYENRIHHMESTKDYSGVIFSDLNGLKYANDNFGHEAGDRLLVRYARLLIGVFPMEDIYRISGDEFICIVENEPEETFQKYVSDLQNVLKQNTPPLASFGAAYGSSENVETLVRDAENRMYEEKKLIHERFPQTRR